MSVLVVRLWYSLPPGPWVQCIFYYMLFVGGLKGSGALAHPLNFPSMAFLLKKLPLVLTLLNFRLDANASEGCRLRCRGLRIGVLSGVPSWLSSACWAISDKSHALSGLPFLIK